MDQNSLEALINAAQTSEQTKLLPKTISALEKVNYLLENQDPSGMQFLKRLHHPKEVLFARRGVLNSSNKAPFICFLRLILKDTAMAVCFNEQCIPIFLTRAIEYDELTKGLDENLAIPETLKLLKYWISCSPSTFPALLAYFLVSLGGLPATNMQQKEKGKLTLWQPFKMDIVPVVLEMAKHCPTLCAKAGGFHLLLDIMSTEKSQIETILPVLLAILDEPERNQLAANCIDLRRCFACLVSIDTMSLEDAQRAKHDNRLDQLPSQLSIACSILTHVLRSWSGVFFLSCNGLSFFRCLFATLRQIPKDNDSQLRKSIFGALEELTIKDYECREYFPAEGTRTVAQLINCFHLNLIQTLLEAGLFQLLFQLAGTGNSSVSQSAIRLIKKLSAFDPSSIPRSQTQVDWLAMVGSTQQSDRQAKGSASLVRNRVSNFDMMSHQTRRNSLLEALSTTHSQSVVSIEQKQLANVLQALQRTDLEENPFSIRQLLDQKPIPSDATTNPSRWNWQLLEEILSVQSFDLFLRDKSAERSIIERIFKDLRVFFDEKSDNFRCIPFEEIKFNFIKIHRLYLKSLMGSNKLICHITTPSESQFSVTLSLMDEMNNLLSRVLKASSLGIYWSFYRSLQRELLFTIGLFSQYYEGHNIVFKRTNYFASMQAYIGNPNCHAIIAFMLHSMNYLEQGSPAAQKEDSFKSLPHRFLRSCVSKGCEQVQLACVQVLKTMFAEQIEALECECIEMWLKLLERNEDESEVLSRAISAIQEALATSQSIVRLFIITIKSSFAESSQLLVWRKLSNNIKFKLLSLSEGFQYITHSEEGLIWLNAAYVKTKSYSPMLIAELEKALSPGKAAGLSKLDGYQIQLSCQPFFLYRLPLWAKINKCEVPLFVRSQAFRLVLWADVQGVIGNSNNAQKQDEIQVQLFLGNIPLGRNMVRDDYYYSELSIKDPKKIRFFNHQTRIKLQNNALTAYFYPSNNISTFSIDLVSNKLHRIQINVALQQQYKRRPIPMCLFEELAKNPFGREYLASKDFFRQAEIQLAPPIRNVAEAKCQLWFLGYFGCADEAIRLLKDNGLLKVIIWLSFNCRVASVRGTARIVLSLLCRSQRGCLELEAQGFLVNRRTFSCLHAKFTDNSSFEEGFISKKPRIIKCEFAPMNKEQTLLFDHICKAANPICSQTEQGKIKQLLRVGGEEGRKVEISWPLYINVLQLLSSRRLRFQVRRYYRTLFKDFERSPLFQAKCSELFPSKLTE